MSRMSTHDVDNHKGNFLGENSPAEHGDDGELTWNKNYTNIKTIFFKWRQFRVSKIYKANTRHVVLTPLFVAENIIKYY